ncbi:hypothetical protein KBB25_02530 [Candidatus Gracilibacteria bacterium]|nr:hypothetical protein [Candidatus Gracilibacteria bacterium]
MNFLRSIFIFFLLLPFHVFAISKDDIGFGDQTPQGSIFSSGSGNGWNLISVLRFVEEILLKVALPLVLVGTFLYLAYQLLTADGDETRMKKAWKGVTYSIVGMLTITVAYAVVALILQLQF